jgi:hypothetical protein
MKKLLVMLLTAGAIAFTAGSAVAQGGGSSHGDAPKSEPPAATAPATPAPAAEAKKEDAAPAPAATSLAQAAAPAEQKAEEEAKPTVDKGDVAFMYTATIMVILMTIPGLALFYGGLVRSKNMLSVLMQVFVIFSLITVLWVVYGYTLAFGGPGAFYGSFDKLFLSGVTAESMAATFSKGVYLPELTFIAFQGTFAAITCALIVGAYAERMKFSAVLLFMVIWFTFSYIPMAHMVWYWDGPDAIKDQATLDAQRRAGYFLDLWQWRANLSNPLQRADDQNVAWYRLYDTGDTLFFSNWDLEGQRPRWMFDPASGGGPALRQAPPTATRAPLVICKCSLDYRRYSVKLPEWGMSACSRLIAGPVHGTLHLNSSHGGIQ